MEATTPGRRHAGAGTKDRGTKKRLDERAKPRGIGRGARLAALHS